MAAKATAVFEGDDSNLAAAFKRIDKALIGIEVKVVAVGASIAAAFAGPALVLAALGVGVAAFGMGVKHALDLGGEFADLAANSGAAVEDLVVLAQEFKNAGKAGEDIGPVISKMQKAIASGSANDTIAELGLSLEELRRQTPVDQFHALGVAIDRLESPARRTLAAIALFGKSGATLLSMFGSKGFGDAAAEVGKQAAILGKDAALFDYVSDKLNTTGLKVQGFWVGAADRIAPVLKPLLDSFSKLDLSGFGQQVGNAVAYLYSSFADGGIGEILGASLKIAFGETANFFTSQLLGGVALVAQAWLQAIAAAVSMMINAAAQIVEELGPKLYRESVSPFHGTAEKIRAVGAKAYDAIGGNLDVAEGYKAAKEKGRFYDSALDFEALASATAAVIARAGARREQALNDVPTKTRGIGDDLFGGSFTPNVGALTRVGGGFGGGGSGPDPLLTESQRQTTLLQRLIDETIKRTPPGQIPGMPLSYG